MDRVWFRQEYCGRSRGKWHIATVKTDQGVQKSQCGLGECRVLFAEYDSQNLSPESHRCKWCLSSVSTEVTKVTDENDSPRHVMHVLKCWPAYFEDTLAGHKMFEVRVNDRDFGEGDYLVLYEYLPIEEKCTGRAHIVRVTGIWGVPGTNYVGMAIAPVEVSALDSLCNAIIGTLGIRCEP
jgi:hypothetical protein